MFLNKSHLSSQFCLSEEIPFVFFINLSLLWRCSILSWIFDEPQNIGLVLWLLHATLCYPRPLVALSPARFFYLWALWDCSKWELELSRNNMLQAIMDITIEFPGRRSLILIQTLSVSVNSFSCFSMTLHFQSFQSKFNFRST